MKNHDIDTYRDGYLSISYCKICSAEGEKLLEDCPQNLENMLDVHKSDDKYEALKTRLEPLKREY